MTKPIAYYLSNPDDSDTIAEIAVTYGDRLQSLDRGQKIHLISEAIDTLAERFDLQGDLSNSAPDSLIEQIESLSNDTLLGLLSAIADQLRHGK